MRHLRHAGLPFAEQAAVLEQILRADALLWPVILRAGALALPDWLIVSGALYNTVWNHLTGKPAGYGIKDIDLFYHDVSDLSWEAEDAVITRSTSRLGDLGLPIEIRNQARVHLWFPQRFGSECPYYESSAHSLRFFASQTHAVGVCLDADGRFGVEAPFGLDHIFSFRMVPNRALPNRATHEKKSARALALWPELTVVPW